MAIIRNLTNQVVRFVDSADQVVRTYQPDGTVVVLVEGDTTTTVLSVRLRTLKPAAFVGLPAAVAGTFLIVGEGIALALWERGKGRTDVYEPEEPITANGEVCYRGARRYID